MEHKKVMIYTSTTCPYCEMAKDYFKSKGIEYEEMSTTEPENRKKLVSLGIRGVPAIFIGDKHVVGFDPVEIEKLMNEPSVVAPEPVIAPEMVQAEYKPVVPISDKEVVAQEEPATPAQPVAPSVSEAPVKAEVNVPTIIEEKKEDKSMKKYVCTVCGYVYDPAVGDVENGIVAGTSFDDLPEDWVWPLCGVAKDLFDEESNFGNT